jgi:hypothetical protein
MGPGAKATQYAGRLYKRLFNAVRIPVQKVEEEVHHLHEIEHEGESAETPAIAFLGLILFLLPLFLVMLGLAFAAYYLAR